MANKSELESASDLSTSTLLIKLMEIMENGIKETQQLGKIFIDDQIKFGNLLLSAGQLSADKNSSNKFVYHVRLYLEHLTRFSKPRPGLIKQDIVKMKGDLLEMSNCHWGTYNRTLIQAVREGLRKINVIPEATSIPETLKNAISSIGNHNKEDEF